LRSTIFKWSFFMKKNVLALSITAAVVGLGFAGGAQAMQGALGGSSTGFLTLNGDGVGHSLFIPYFSSQGNNNTLITLINTDVVNGKAVKVRFRGAANSDDIFDFQVFLSPGDVWTANVSKGGNGASKLFTPDNSCTKPDKATVNSASFVTGRLDPTLTGDNLANGTREGYIEIFNMGDIPPLKAGVAPVVDLSGALTAGYDAAAANTANPLFTAIKHVGGVAPCAGTAWTYLDGNAAGTTNLLWDTVVAAPTTPRSAGLLPPTTGLMGNWTIINTVGAAAWTGEAVAVQATNPPALVGDPFIPGRGNVVYWAQTAFSAALPAGGTSVVDNYTADPLFRSDAQKPLGAAPGTIAAGGAAIPAGMFDLPDMSTPYVIAGAAAFNPLEQARGLTNSIAAKTVTNEYLTTSVISATTDWVFSQPTRRYSTALNYAAIAATDDGRRFSELVDDGVAGSIARGYYIPGNTVQAIPDATVGRQICARNIGFTYFDQEERSFIAGVTPVISPNTLPPAVNLCGEASVLSINNGLATGPSGSLKATVSLRDVTTGYSDGWMIISTPSGGFVNAAPAAGIPGGLPLVGAAYERAVGGGTNTFGATYNHRLSR
jgi:hypothetical protein